MAYTGGYGPGGYGERGNRPGLRTIGTLGLLAANVLSLGLGIWYLTIKEPGGVWNLYGLLMLLTLLGNLHLTMGRGVHKVWEYVYLALHALGLTAVPVLNTLASAAVRDYDSRSLWTAIVLLALFALGAWVALLRVQGGTEEKEDKRGGNGYSPYSSSYGGASRGSLLGKILKALLTLWFLANLALGLYFSAVLLAGIDPGLVETILPEYSLFFGLIFLGAAALLVKMYGRRRGFFISLFRGTVRVIGLLILVVCALPLASAPKIINEAQDAYTKAFGGDPMETHGKGLMKTAFLLPDYFYGAESGDYRVQTDIVYYEGQDSTGDAGLKLRFDVYMPPKGKSGTGQGTALIRIHGGGWTIGDKGAGNYAQMNKYFASRGYVVFDVQYGLSDAKKFVESAVVPKDVVGHYGIDDMVRHIGLFTVYLEKHAAEYGANPASVFLSGGSAGGQLAAAAGLAPTNAEFADMLAPGIKVKGIIPFYPANGLAGEVGVDSGALGDPSILVNADSPPALVYQGEHDGIVDPETAHDFVRAYRAAGNARAALIEMPMGTHGSDMYFPSYYNMPFTYMMERFMLKYR
ncbi:hypothetical protein CDO73_09785 [Saccharibacillus sp. O23]|uniref:alpha/beta hydrolase fold domain-containing protein n=1 Tax=Saccharibacillus sp. O23 TaxID=2009338 RepID=UPI000B4DFE4F|nr:alpha/beta hydrolase fold domain-containing protein [Saccharibacillus sp. O23]OWR30869.1 hypothetical protein CDO73_09785 [Saccharibacillus sp. O23]